MAAVICGPTNQTRYKTPPPHQHTCCQDAKFKVWAFFPIVYLNYHGNNIPGTARPLNACLNKYPEKGNNHLDLIQTVGIAAYAVPHEQRKAHWKTAGAGLQGRGCSYLLLAKHLPTRSSTKFLSENGSVHATALLSRCIQAVPGLIPCLEKSTSKGLPASCRRRHPCSTLSALSNFCKTHIFFHVCLSVHFCMQFYKHPCIILQHASDLDKTRPCYSHLLSAQPDLPLWEVADVIFTYGSCIIP